MTREQNIRAILESVFSQAKDELIDIAVKNIMTLNDWIPVSERLPEEETDVLICNGDGDIELSRGSYSTEVENDFIWYTSGWRFGKVIAWMPLPKRYEPQESEIRKKNI